jgi:hypothetical protein
MAVFYIIYAILLLTVLTYVGVNAYHLVRFRLDVPGDKSVVALALYLFFVVGILLASIVVAMPFLFQPS